MQVGIEKAPAVRVDSTTGAGLSLVAFVELDDEANRPITASCEKGSVCSR